MKWRRLPALTPPQVVLDDRIGPHLVQIEVHKHVRAVQIVGKSRSFVCVSATSAEHCLVRAARLLGYEPDGEAES